MFYNFFPYFSGGVDSTGSYTTQQRIKVIDAYFATKLVLLTQRQCRRDFGRNNVPDRRTIQHLVAKFRETGSVINVHKGHSYWHCSAIIPENIQNLPERLEESPRKSTHHLSRETGKEMGGDMNTVIYQQDGAPPHCSGRSLEFLCRYFPGDRLISRCTDFPWPPYSLELNPYDYFLWRYPKERVYDNNPQTLADLKGNIRRDIRCIPADIIGGVIDNFNVRLAAVIHQGWAWIEHIINY